MFPIMEEAMPEIVFENLSHQQKHWFPVLKEMGLRFLDMFGVLYGDRTFYLKRPYGDMPAEPYPVYSLRVYVHKDGRMKINTLTRKGTRNTWEEVSFPPIMTKFLKKKTTRFLNGFVEAGLKAEQQEEKPILKPHNGVN